MKNQEPEIIAIGVGSTGKQTIEYLQQINPTIQTYIVNDLQENYSDLEKNIAGAGVTFITTGLNDTIGMEIAAVIAKMSKALGSLTISVVPLSFFFDNREASEQAKIALAQLEKEFDAIVTPNIQLLSEPIRSQSILKTLNDTAIQTISTISNLITARGKNDIRLDLSDLKVIMRGNMAIGASKHTGKESASKAMASIINSPFASKDQITTATAIAVSFEMHPDFSLLEITDVMQVIEDLTDENTDIVFATTTDETLAIDYIKITVMASHFKGTHVAINRVRLGSVINSVSTPNFS
jgi:cell division protein FtsZ